MQPAPLSTLDGLGVYVINLDRSADRLAVMSERFAEVGLSFERIPGVDGNALDLTSPELADTIDFDYWAKFHHRNMLPTEIGCYLSHLRAIDRFAQSAHQFALIVEDDVRPPESFPTTLSALIAAAADWDLVRLYTGHPGYQPIRRRLADGSALTSFIQRPAGAVAYLISRKAIDQMKPYLTPIRLPFDHVYDRGFENGLRVRGVEPMPIKTGDQKSVIEAMRIRKKGPFHSWGDPPLETRWRVPVYRMGTFFRRLYFNLITDGAAGAIIASLFSGAKEPHENRKF